MTGANGKSDYATLLSAISFAAHKHRAQRRKDAEASPYINHPLALAHVLATEGRVTDLKTLVAAALHDTIEDTETTCEELVERFGKAVADVVMEVTDDKTLPKSDRKRLQIEHAPHISKRAALVKLADKTCNLRDVANNPPADWRLERKQEYFDWAKAVVAGLPLVNKRLLEAFDAACAARPGR
jgi:GTP diphosphokinase / guanosine-3',5'-bis(diphosphate) 3'-diphosphatase